MATNNFKTSQQIYDERQQKKQGKYQTRDEKFEENFVEWVTYWRHNIHRFATEYLGIKLKLFQVILLVAMDMFPNFTYIASRGTGKSWLIALYAIIRCILYPDTDVVISSATRGQAILMIKEKVRWFNDNFPPIANEIKLISDGNQDPKCEFWNGSKIVAVTPSDSSRGFRCNILILEEYAIMKKDIIDYVLKKFGTTPRTPAFMELEEYKHSYPQEPNRELYISSARYKSEWGWKHVQDFWINMIKGIHIKDEKTGELLYIDKSYMIISSDWKLPLFEGLFDEAKMRRELASEGLDEIGWSMEMDTIWFGENELAKFKLRDFNRNRKIKEAFYPNEHSAFMTKVKKNIPKPLKKKQGNIRILSVDVASTPKAKSDNTIINCMTAIETTNGYNRELNYSEAINGEKITEQCLRIKQLWYDFNADYIILDGLNIGRELYALMTQETYDEVRNIKYPPMICYNDEDYKEWAYDKNGLQNIFMFLADATLNDQALRALLNSTKHDKIRFLMPENEAKDMFTKSNPEFAFMSAEERLEQMYPYIQTTICINEVVSLEGTEKNGKLSVKKSTTTDRKDRYTALSNGDWFITYQLEMPMLTNETKEEADAFVLFG